MRNDRAAEGSGPVTIPAEESSANLTISIQDESVVEPDETFTVFIVAPPPGINLADDTGIGTIRNDD